MGYKAVGAISTGGSIATDLTGVALPTHASGDLLVIFVVALGTGDSTATSTGYSEIAFNEQGTGGNRHRLTVLAKFDGGSESNPDVAFGTAPGSSCAAFMASFDDIDAAIEDVAEVDDGTGDSGALEHTPTGLTTSTANATVVSFVSTSDDNTTGVKSGSEQGFTERAGGASYDWTAGSDGSAGLATKEQATAGAVTMPTWEQTVNGNDTWASISLAFKPAGAGTLPLTLTPNADGTRSNVLNENTGTADLYASVDDDPDTPTTTDWISAFDNDGHVFLDMTPTPDNFGDAVSLEVRASVEAALFTTDQSDLYAQVFAANETTTYTDEVLFASEASDGLVTSSFTINATGLAASKASWDTARIKLRWDYTA